ncbi:flagellar biosynthesis protein FlhA [Metaclostridioides mangenotii]|uniref:Flagellar biosynthesis protein FlhA n=1 Tax=Metaclostridioides mangenotii TaxID=1540 RepID=A0ABS4ECF9_9FIRM|nr:flagellar biosynthesis protein FlhA [Clostridioides mangenotii]MBP1855638.1 flagellar biosynthesis protein FlhA [Clostridioides mangenotii]
MKKVNLKGQLDIIVALGVMCIILMIIIPLPTFLLDLLLSVNISLSILILLMTLFTKNILELSIFPTMLLITTLFRLGLNMSSTRLILSQGYAGNVIEAFGSFVVGGNYVVGIIIFLIIIIVQFVVITNGSGRVSEVSARFTLDAMPGKQMSIDADLNSGTIDEDMAKKRREELQQEADFFGSMDGASKFVKGDAIAGIIITLINIVGGIIIGVLMMDMTLTEAGQTFVRLTIGDGLVSQIPALLISVSSGILVTRVASDDNFGTLVGKQLTSIPKAIIITGVVLIILGLMPGLPKFAFFSLGIGAMVSGYFLSKDSEEELDDYIVEDANMVSADKNEAEDVKDLINVEVIEVEIGYGLIALADESSGGDLLQRIASIRRQCAIDMGIIVQPIRIRDNLQLNPNQYNIKIKGNIVSSYEIIPNMVLCMDSVNQGFSIDGIKTTEPTFGLEALWIDKDKLEEAELKGYTIVDSATILITHLMDVIKSNAHELLGRQEVKNIIDITRENYSAVVEELIPDLMTLGEIQKILQNLLKEKVSIRDRVTILETLADQSIGTKDLEVLTEYVRIALNRSICANLVDENNTIVISTLSKDVENMISDNIQRSINGNYPAIDPEYSNKIFEGIQEIIRTVYFNNNIPAIVVSPKIRAPFRKLTEIVFPNLMVLSLNEIPNDIQIKAEGVVEI